LELNVKFLIVNIGNWILLPYYFSALLYKNPQHIVGDEN